MLCKICDNLANKKLVLTRSGKKIAVFFCNKCDFEFFNYNPIKNLEANKLDIFRLYKAGLRIPSKNIDFLNGLRQSKTYINDHLFKERRKKLNILDIGCSWGSFLYSVKKLGHNPFGIELNKIRINFVKKKLKIACESNLDFYEKENIKFDYIFLIYSIEYFIDPKNYIIRLLKNLKKNGKIIIITPNKNDLLMRVLKEEKYSNFFYDVNSVNYFSSKSLEKLLQLLKVKKYNMHYRQGYSLVNFFNWFFFKKPFFTGYVGEDRFIEDIIKKLNNSYKNSKEYKKPILRFAKFIKEISNDYKLLATKNKLANIITLEIYK